MTNKNQIMDKVKGFIEPFLSFDREGLVTSNMSELGYFTYRSMLKDSGRDYVEGEINGNLLRKAAKQVLRHNEDDIDPNINGFPTQPFEPEMTQQSMTDIWNVVKEEDLVAMNNGESPLDGPDGIDVNMDQIRKGWPVYMSPGKYAIAIGGRPDQMTYLTSKKTGKLYQFNYGTMAKELKMRRRKNVS